MCMHACSVSKFITNVHIMHIHEENQYLETIIINMVYIPSGEVSISIKTCDTINTGLQLSLIQYCYYYIHENTIFILFSSFTKEYNSMSCRSAKFVTLMHIYIHVIH